MSILTKNSYDYVFKVIVIGDSGVGKTNLILRFSEQTFKDNYVATIGVDFKTKNIVIGDKQIKLQLWDTAGQERFRTITQTYYKGAAGICLAYSVDDRQSFQNIGTGKWMKQIKDKTPPNVQKIILANKVDLPDQERQVKFQEGERMAEFLSDEGNNVSFMEVSAKNGHNVNEAFTKVCQQIKDYMETNQLQTLGRKSSVIKISHNEDGEGKCMC